MPDPSLFWGGLSPILADTLPSDQAESFIHPVKPLLCVRPTLGTRGMPMSNTPILTEEIGSQGRNCRCGGGARHRKWAGLEGYEGKEESDTKPGRSERMWGGHNSSAWLAHGLL